MTDGRTIRETLALTAAQCRAGRSLLGWSQQDLAGHATVATSTVADFERDKRSPVANNLEAMRSALEKAGVTFPPGGAVIGPWRPKPTSFSVPHERLSPMRWVTETDLVRWADTRAGQDTMPELVRRLILAEQGYVLYLRFPSGDSVSMQGWDGECKADVASSHVPSGSSGWEIGVDQHPGKKANSVYGDRVKNPLHLKPAETTFVFVTSRRWAQKGTWLAKRRAENRWAGVRAMDAVDLVQWIERYPGVGLWLATLLGKTPAGVRELKEFWREWSIATRRPISTDLILADRDHEAIKVLRWLYNEPSVMAMQGESTDESVSFFYTAIAQLPQQYADYYLTRSVVVADANMARGLANVGTSLIIALEEGDVGLARVLVEKGHHVFLPFGSGVGAPSDVMRLKRPTRYAIEHDLKAIGFPDDEAKRYARDSGRSLTIIRRLIPAAPGVTSPEWASGDTARLLLPVLLAGGWDDAYASDKLVIERLSGESYDAFVGKITPLLPVADSPIRKVGTTWRLASPRDAWFRIACFLSNADMDRFGVIAEEVLGATDPRFEMPAEDRWLANIKGKSPQYSEFLQQGLAETLILFNVFGDRANSVAYPAAKATKIIKQLLNGANAERWWSLSPHLEELAEAAPEAFLDAIEKSLDQNEPPIMALFSEEPGIFGSSNHTHLLWALETLAWSPDYLARVSEALARLAMRDPGGKLSNRPERSLSQVFLLWHPQTYATSKERLQVIKRLRERENAAAWQLMLALYPSSHGIAHDAPMPRWRDFSVSPQEPVTRSIMIKAAEQLGEWLLEDVGKDVGRWADLTKRFADFSQQTRTAYLAQLEAFAETKPDDGDRVKLQSAIRRFIHHHRQFPASQWALAEAELAEMEKVYHALTPDDAISKIAWMFEAYGIARLHPAPAFDFHAEQEAANQDRRNAVKDVIATNNMEAVIALFNAVKAPALVGQAVAEVASPEVTDDLMMHGLRANSEAGRNFAFGIIRTLNQVRGPEWAAALLERARSERWSDGTVVDILMSLPRSEMVLRVSSTFSPEVERRYWTEAGMHWINAGHDNIAWVSEKLIDFKRARDAIHLIGAHLMHVPNSTVIRALRGALKEQESLKSDDHNTAVMFQHHVQEIFQKLDKADDVSEEDVALLEWSYLAILEHSSRPPKALHHRLATSPQFFVELLSLLYRSTNEKDDNDLLAEEDRETRSNIASQAYRLLHSWHGMAGLTDGAVNATALQNWVKEARSLCEKSGRKNIGDQKIGETFAWAPADPDGTWPCLAVRKVIENSRSEDLETGVLIGVRNSRGITTRSPLDGGILERGEAAKYRKQGKALRLEFPRTFAVLERIAQSYDYDAKEHDDDVDRRQL